MAVEPHPHPADRARCTHEDVGARAADLPIDKLRWCAAIASEAVYDVYDGFPPPSSTIVILEEHFPFQHLAGVSRADSSTLWLVTQRSRSSRTAVCVLW